MKQVLVELDGRPASELYERFLSIDRSQVDNAEEGYTFPLLASYKGEAWLRSAIHIDEDGSLDQALYQAKEGGRNRTVLARLA